MSHDMKEDQAKKLQQLFAEVVNDTTERAVEEESEQQELIEVDVLALPPRSEVHLSPKSKIKLSLKKPYVRFMIVFLILIGLSIGVYYYFGEQILVFLSRT